VNVFATKGMGVVCTRHPYRVPSAIAPLERTRVSTRLWDQAHCFLSTKQFPPTVRAASWLPRRQGETCLSTGVCKMGAAFSADSVEPPAVPSPITSVLPPSASGTDAHDTGRRDDSHHRVSSGTVPAFLRARSAVLIAALQDDLTADWRTVLPPAVSDGVFDRQLHLLRLLQRLDAERGSADPFRICHIRARPLFDCLAGVPQTTVTEALELAEYVQLPKALALAIQQHNETLPLMRVPLGRSWWVGGGAAHDGEAPLYDVLRASALLSPLLEAAEAVVPVQRPGQWWSDDRVCFGRDDTERCYRSYMLGLCGAPLPPAPDTEEAQQDTAFPTAAHAAGLLVAGHPRDMFASAHRAARISTGVLADAMACKGDLEGLEWVRSNGWGCDSRAAASLAASFGRLRVLEHLWPEISAVPDMMPTYIASAAAGAGQRRALQFLASRGVELHAALVAAVQRGRWEVLRWLVEEAGIPRHELHARECEGAAQRGDMPMLQYLRAHGFHWDETVSAAMAWKGHQPVLEWARAQDPPCPWDASTCSSAAGNGHLELLRWARAQSPPCPWDGGRGAINSAAEGGHVNVLAWGHAQAVQDPPCPWNEAGMRWAVRSSIGSFETKGRVCD